MQYDVSATKSFQAFLPSTTANQMYNSIQNRTKTLVITHFCAHLTNHTMIQISRGCMLYIKG